METTKVNKFIVSEFTFVHLLTEPILWTHQSFNSFETKRTAGCLFDRAVGPARGFNFQPAPDPNFSPG